MLEAVLPTLVVILAPVAVSLFLLVKGRRAAFLSKTDSDAEPFAQPVRGSLDCRIRLTEQKDGDCLYDDFCVEIRGSIDAHAPLHHTEAQITITDVTALTSDKSGTSQAGPVRAKVKQQQASNSDAFVFRADLGRLPERVTTLSDWLTIGRINPDWLVFPGTGKRQLQFDVLILTAQTHSELARGRCTFDYENNQLGYVDLQENANLVKTLATALGFAVSAADGKLYHCEVEVIKNWARSNIDFCGSSQKQRRRLERALKKTTVFFRRGGKIDTHKICDQIVRVTSLAQRRDILELCLKVAAANGTASPEELDLLKNLAGWLGLDEQKFCAMTEKFIPIDMHQVKDPQVLLGVTSSMDRDQKRRLFNKEYRKWNARVTSSNRQIQSQADHMLRFIAEARRQYVG